MNINEENMTTVKEKRPDVVRRLAVKHLLLDLEHDVIDLKEGKGVQVGSFVLPPRPVKEETTTEGDKVSEALTEKPNVHEWMAELDKEGTEVLLSKNKIKQLATQFSIVSPYANTYFAVDDGTGEGTLVRLPFNSIDKIRLMSSNCLHSL